MPESSFRACLEAILDGAFGPLPEPDENGVSFWRPWLAQRNLGLVPVADPGAFSWPGPWIGVARSEAILMFGSPSGPILDPAGVGDAPLEAGFVVAPLDLHLDRLHPYGTAPGAGVVEAVLVAPAAEAPLVRVEAARAVPGLGLEGDRYALGVGTFSSGKGSGRELTLVAAEALEALPLAWEDARRNVVTRGIDLNALVGKRFRIGEVECRAERLAEPCAHLERLTRPGVLRGLVHRAGIRADILAGGEIRVGDAVHEG